MADVYKKIRGIVGNLFQFDGGDGPQLKNSSGVIESKNSDDSDFALLRGSLIPSSGETVNDVPALLDLRGRIADIQFSFDGGSAPSPGANTGKFGFCHTTGGSYTAGQVVYDDGSSLIIMPTAVVKHITTRTAISGTISLDANGIYCNQAGTWTLKGDGAPSNTGLVKAIRVDYVYTDSSVSSTTSIPDGASVLRVRNGVTTALDGSSPTIQVVVDGTSDEEILATGDSNQKKVGEYHREDTHDITSSTEGPVTVNVTPDGSTQGAGFVIVEYTTPHS